MRIPSNIYHGVFLYLLTSTTVQAASAPPSSTARNPPSSDVQQVCKRVPHWVYESHQVLTFCRWFYGMSHKPPVPPVVKTLTSTISKTTTTTVVNTVTARTGVTSTVTQTSLTTFTPTATTQTTTTVDGGLCPTPVYARNKRLKNKRDLAPRSSAGLSGLDNLSQEVQLQVEAAMLDGAPDLLGELGLAADDARKLCWCVLELVNHVPPRPTTITTKTTSSKTVSAFSTTTTTVTTTVIFTITTVSTVNGTPTTTTQTVTTTTCLACTPNGGPCLGDRADLCCSGACEGPGGQVGQATGTCVP